MIAIQLERKQIRILYTVVIVLDLFILFMNTPFMSLPVAGNQPTRLSSPIDFIRYQLDLKNEQNIATWYSSVLLLCAGTMAVLNCWFAPVSSRFKRVHQVGWLLMAFVLVALSIDETATIHETLPRLLNAMNDGGGGTPYKLGAGDWIPILLPLVIVVVGGMVVLFSYVLRNNGKVLLLAVGGLLSWIGAIFAESIEGGLWRLTMSRVTEGFIEEGCEIVGTTCLLIAFSEFLWQRQSASEAAPGHKPKGGVGSRIKRQGKTRLILFVTFIREVLSVRAAMKIVALLSVAAILVSSTGAGDLPCLQAALEVARWIRSSAIQTERGTVWPSAPRDAGSVNTTLYSGAAGTALFFIEAYRSTGDRAYLKDARAGADHLLATFTSEKECGLYVGIAGIGFALAETFKTTGESKYRQGALRCSQLLGERARKAGKGIEWNDTTDVIAGGAGIGLYLLYAARELKEPAFREFAIQAAHRLIELGMPEENGMKWRMSPGFARLMPNFSHGTAGIAYFLATLYQETKRREFLDAALAGAKYLRAVAKTDNDVCLIFHNEPEGKDLYYLGWCHGPVGTARLFYRLYQVTGDPVWVDWVKKSARGIIESGIPEKETPGFWNNVSQCCGSAGVAEFFLSLHKVTRERAYLEFSKRVTAQLLSKATRDRDGMRWIQAEHRVRPELLVAQTGYMQGAAGIGMLFLRMDDFQRGKKASIIFPDSPFD